MNNVAQRDMGISFVRLISMLMIISCHILQYFGNGLAWWLNCGVQVFLFMSGFLYGEKKIENTFSFLRKQIPKILVDYYSSVIFTIIVYFFFAREALVGDKVFKLLFLGGVLDGIGQVWFVSTIIFCYLLTPIFSSMIEKIINTKHIYIFLIALLLITHIEIKLIIPYFTPAWINCYIIGLMIGKLRCMRWERKWQGYTAKIFIPLCVVANGIKIIQNYFIQYPFEAPKIIVFYRTFCNYAHVFLGITVFWCCINYFIGYRVI